MKETATNTEKFVWNMLGSLSNALSTLIMSISVNRILGGDSGGIFAFAYSNAQLMLTIGMFEVRPYQSTDIQEKYSFNTYFSFRILTCQLMFIISIVYAFSEGFAFEKSMVIVFLSLFKLVEAFTDVFAGRFQQKDRIDISGKLFFIRVVCSTLLFIVIMLITHDLMLASVGMFLVSLLLFFFNDFRYIFEEDRRNIAVQLKQIPGLIKEVLPLFIGSFIMMYISNAPKYAINNIYGDKLQNIYNILFMPAFVINLFSLFVFRPMLINMTTDWNQGNRKGLWKAIFKVSGMILSFTALALIGTYFLGIPILSMFYGVDLERYRQELLLVMFTGSLSAFMTFSYYIVTILRQQKYILVGYAAAFVYVNIISNILVRRLEVAGAILAYGSTISIIILGFVAIIVYTSLKRWKNAI